MAITNGGAATIANNTNFGSTCATGGTVSKTYTIKNTGGANLTLSGSPLAVLGGTDAASFAVSTQPTSPVAASGSTTFTVVFDPTSAGAKSATVTLTNNDATNSPYIINIAGTGNADPTITTSASSAICTGATSFTIPYTATTGTPTTYSVSGTGITTVTNGALPATPITVNLSSGASGSSISYTLTVQNANTCTSNPATMGSVTVNTTSAPTSPMATPSTVASGNMTTLTASGCSGGTLSWYDAANPSVPLPNNTPTITSGKTFFSRCMGSDGCVSAPSSDVIVSFVLPVELLRFEGKYIPPSGGTRGATEGGNLLTWTTANEVNNKGFDIERLTVNGEW